MKNHHKLIIQSIILSLLIIVLAFSRIIPHLPNFSPLGAVCLFGACHFQKRWQAFFVPIFATWLSDLYLNNVLYNQEGGNFIWFYHGFHWQYISYLFIALLGLKLFSRKINPGRILIGAVGSSIIFFLISNFGVWVSSGMYSKNIYGLISCYLAGIPFIKGTMVGNLFYTPIVFYSYYFLQVKFAILNTRTKRYSFELN
tara:strand:+ start:859 stop:1455 length:597 start_codon:yes stop_codon:yes gene_type:complete